MNPFIGFLLASALSAHDMWIEPTTFYPEPGQIVGARLRVGQELIGDPLPRDPSLVKQFVVEDGSGRKSVGGRTGGDPAGLLRASGAGVMVIGYRSNPSPVEQTGEKFDQYLKEEGLDAIAAARAKRGKDAASVHEIFSRCAKSLVLSGTPGAGPGDRTLGFSLELVAERNPYGIGPGDELPVRLTFENRPLAGALVVAMNRQSASQKLTARTGADGRVRLRLPRQGMWLVKAVHMTPAPEGSNAEWESFWASLTFELRAAETAKK